MKDSGNTFSKNENIKGSLFRWTPESAMWYEKASQFTGYHDRLAEILRPYIDKSQTCLEIACGTGTLARHLCGMAASYTANDIDKNATYHLREMIKDGSCPGLEVVNGDWAEVFKDRTFDNVIFSYFGAVVNDWDILKKIAGKQLIVITPQKKDGRMKVAAEKAEAEKNNPDSPKRIVRGAVRSFETGVSVSDFLDSKGAKYIRSDHVLEFGQPFDNLSQAREYTRYYYRIDEKDMDFFLEKKLIKKDGIWFFPKKKEISVIVIDMAEENSET